MQLCALDWPNYAHRAIGRIDSNTDSGTGHVNSDEGRQLHDLTSVSRAGVAGDDFV